MHTRVKLLLIVLVALMLSIPAALAQDETPATPGPFAQTATARFEAESAAETAEATQEAPAGAAATLGPFAQTATARFEAGADTSSSTAAEGLAEATPGPFAQTATARFESGAATPPPAAEQTATVPVEAATSTPLLSEAEATGEATLEAVLEVTEEATGDTDEAGTDAGETESAVRGLPLGVLLIGAVAVLLIGTIVLVRENPRSLEDEE